jgi:type IV pilus assembly protein PilY1
MISYSSLMTSWKQRLQLSAGSKWLRRAMWGVIPLLGAVSFYAISQATPPIAIDLSAEPLYVKGSGAKPTISLALSVEFPTVGAQFRDNYAVTDEYVGYFDFNSCYSYNNNANPDLKRFDRTGPATARECGGTGFSGNFMNWATSSAIDVLRLGLTGGDRIVDTTNLTVLQRAVVQKNFWNNGSYFPAKTLFAAQVTGAVPNNLKGTYAGNIQIANCLNRVHFGTSQEGDCDSPGANSNLGTPATTTPTLPGVVNHTGPLPPGYSTTVCANNGNTCNVSGTKYVIYGRGSSWKIGVFDSNVRCRDSNFDGGISGVNNEQCFLGPDWVAPAPTATLTSDNFFYTRVQVCESADPRTVSPGFCQKQASGNFKPIGNLQKHSDRVRVAAFGYLKDDDYNRYGGVLRAPMKYIGPNTYDQNGALLAGVNAKVEWDPTTGVFTANPEGAAENRSGVINYLNQFGRTATTPGVYKGYDPVSELYYEALRYVQGLPPTPEAVSGVTAAMKDGYPVYDTWVDPHAGGDPSKDYSCVKNNIVLVGDVNTHGDKNIPGNLRADNGDTARSFSLAANEPNFRDWTQVVGGFESNNSVTYPFLKKNTPGATPPFLAINPTTSNPNTATPTATPPVTTAANATLNPARWGMEGQNTGSSNAAYYMAGMAYWGNTQDIRGTTWTAQPSKQRPGMRTKTYVIDVNENSANNDATARRNTQFFLTAKYGGFTDASGKGNPYLNKDGLLDNNNWQKSGDLGEAKTYYLASSAQAVLDGLNEIFNAAVSEGNSIANGSISTTSFTQGGYIYNAKYDPTNWSGDVISTPVAVTTGGNVSVNVATPQWKAATVMNANTAAYFASTRKIIAGRSEGNVNGSAAGVDFNWSSVSGDNGTLKDALDKPTPTATTGDGLAEARLNYLRGVKTNEGSPFRSRSSLLGDIVNSPVVYSKEFGNNVNTPAYKTFLANNSGRPGALFVGANDGMFHAFNAASGAEIFAYIPSWLASKLPALTDPTYNSTKHQSYVDGQTDIAEALVGTNWKTVLLSSTGGGGQGVFALDVSNPAAFDATKVMWEFSDRDDADLGNVMGTPKVVKIQTNAKVTAGVANTPEYEWFAVVPSGVNNFVADGNVSTSKKPHLFLLKLSKTAGTAWALGTNYFKFEIPTVDTLSATVSPGVINFEGATGLAGELDQLYMGDLHGNMWKLDFDTASSTKTLQEISLPNALGFDSLTSGNSNKPLFVAKDSSGNVQPIAITPKIVYGPNKSTIVMFGTGKYMEASDNNLTPVRTQSVYAINDINATPKFVAGRAFLQQGTSSAGTITIASFIWGRAATAGDTTQRSGWYFDYAASGERSVSDFTIAGLKIYFGSVVPPQNLTDPCSGGSGNIYAINFATGSGESIASQVGLIGQIFVQKTINSSISDSDSTDRRTETTTQRIVIKGTEGFQTPPDDIKNVTALGRLSWRQINNYHELKKP